jgi:hypothetical protein
MTGIGKLVARLQALAGSWRQVDSDQSPTHQQRVRLRVRGSFDQTRNRVKSASCRLSFNSGRGRQTLLLSGIIEAHRAH